MRVPIVDEHDNEVVIKERKDLLSTDIYRVSALWLLNDKNDVLLTQRALTKKQHPGRWGCSVAGTVEEGETYQDNIRKETEEEIGLELEPEDLKVGPKMRIHGGYEHFCQFYFATTKKDIEDFVFPFDEVMDAKWMSIPDVIADVSERPDEYSVNLDECLILNDVAKYAFPPALQ